MTNELTLISLEYWEKYWLHLTFVFILNLKSILSQLKKKFFKTISRVESEYESNN